MNSLSVFKNSRMYKKRGTNIVNHLFFLYDDHARETKQNRRPIMIKPIGYFPNQSI